ncbi:hypothetical protein QR680_013169 [Steinernema hermaphroditum]|uniref:EF-hand domain-containing protein n=1 Tax=Steinernema hermaphroditum TaxID=289476 RepID=A0AA39I6W9_9BILA|nr:hypothetical protein QR680_013169 [Steinernema hermaphroditum]
MREGEKNQSAGGCEVSRREIEEAFARCDKTGSQIIPIGMLKVVMRAIGFEPRKDEIKLLTQHMKANAALRRINPDSFDVEELVHVIQNKYGGESHTLTELKSAFSLFDSEGKGFISLDDLRNMAKDLGESIPDDELKEMISAADTRSSGIVSQEDFYAIMKKSCLY